MVALFVLPLPVWADPITLTGGSVQGAVLGISGARITFIGDDFMLRTSTEDFRVSFAAPWPAPGLIPAGTSIDLGAVWRPGDVRGAEAIVNGVHYSDLYVRFGTSGGTFTTPSLVLTGEGTQIVTEPFSFTGFVSAFDNPQASPGDDQPVFRATLVGQGTARAAFAWIPPENALPGGYMPVGLPDSDWDVEYVFGPAVVTPEPASVVLLGTGVLAILFARGRAQRPKHR